jgi:hypothetical protein
MAEDEEEMTQSKLRDDKLRYQLEEEKQKPT